jgi:hypothetical protein
VKNWVLNDPAPPSSPPANWVYYEVSVEGVSSSLTSGDVRQNYVNATLQCRAVRKNRAGEEQEGFVSTVPSVYQVRHAAGRFVVR